MVWCVVKLLRHLLHQRSQLVQDDSNTALQWVNVHNIFPTVGEWIKHQTFSEASQQYLVKKKTDFMQQKLQREKMTNVIKNTMRIFSYINNKYIENPHNTANTLLYILDFIWTIFTNKYYMRNTIKVKDINIILLWLYFR